MHFLIKCSLPMLLVVHLNGCKLDQNISKTKHVFGETTRPRTKEWVQCKRGESQGRLKEIQNYLYRLLDVIVKHNSETFSGDYVKENFCIDVFDNPNDNSAAANPYGGDITVVSGLIKVARNDADIAEILAHEMAHITMQHLTAASNFAKTIETPELRPLAMQRASIKTQIEDLHKAPAELGPPLHDRAAQIRDVIPQTSDIRKRWEKLVELAKSVGPNQFSPLLDYELIEKTGNYVDWNTFPDTFVNALKGWQARIKQLQQELKKVHESLEQLSMKIYGDKYDIFSGEETEADEVGFELLIRAGFDPLATSKAWNLGLENDELRKACETEIIRGGSNIERGYSSHSDNCWRVFNLQVLEMEAHKIDYEPYLRGELKSVVLPGELERLQKELFSTPPEK